jgi:hypothetical protein
LPDPPPATPSEKKLYTEEGVVELTLPPELTAKDVSTFAVDGLPDEIAQLIAPLAVKVMLNDDDVPCVTVTSFDVPATSAVSNSAPNATDIAAIVKNAVIATRAGQKILFLIEPFLPLWKPRSSRWFGTKGMPRRLPRPSPERLTGGTVDGLVNASQGSWQVFVLESWRSA